MDDKKEKEIVDLPDEITDVAWYEYGSLNKLQFSAGKFEYVSNDQNNKLSSCNQYTYDAENNVVNLNCENYKIQITDVSKYRIIAILGGDGYSSAKHSFYNSLDLATYLTDNELINMSNEEIDEIMTEKDFTISKTTKSDEYKNAQLSKLSSLNELSVDEFMKIDGKALTLLINPNMNIDSYDFIPIFIDWKNRYPDYSFYYINGYNLTMSDYDVLNNDPVLKDYLTGLYDNNILISNDGHYKRISVDLTLDGYEEKVFNCTDQECDAIDMHIYDDENEYESIEDVLTE